MSTIQSGTGRVRPFLGMLALGVALLFGVVPVDAAHAQTSPEDRSRFIAITRNLEEDPLRADARADRTWALDWLMEAPDVSVTICQTSLGGLEDDYPHNGAILLQYAFVMAVLIIEHPETAGDMNTQQAAGIEGALRAYRAILGAEPGARSPALDSLLEIEARGGVAEYVQSNAANCS